MKAPWQNPRRVSTLATLFRFNVVLLRFLVVYANYLGSSGAATSEDGGWGKGKGEGGGEGRGRRGVWRWRLPYKVFGALRTVFGAQEETPVFM